MPHVRVVWRCWREFVEPYESSRRTRDQAGRREQQILFIFFLYTSLSMALLV